MDNLLSWIIFLPFVAALIVGVIPSGQKQVIKVIALVATLLQLVLGVLLFISFDRGIKPASWEDAFQFTELLPWISLKLGNYGFLKID